MEFPFADYRLTPHYPKKSPLEDVLRYVAPGSDQYITEKYAMEISQLLAEWAKELRGNASRTGRAGQRSGFRDATGIAGCAGREEIAV